MLGHKLPQEFRTPVARMALFYVLKIAKEVATPLDSVQPSKSAYSFAIDRTYEFGPVFVLICVQYNKGAESHSLGLELKAA